MCLRGGDVRQLFGKQQIGLTSEADVCQSQLLTPIDRSSRRPFVIFVQLNQALSTSSAAVYYITWRVHECHVSCMRDVKAPWGRRCWTVCRSSRCCSHGKLPCEEAQLEFSAVIFLKGRKFTRWLPFWQHLLKASAGPSRKGTGRRLRTTRPLLNNLSSAHLFVSRRLSASLG